MKRAQVSWVVSGIILATAFFFHGSLFLRQPVADIGEPAKRDGDRAIGVDPAEAGLKSCAEIIRSACSQSSFRERKLVLEMPEDSIMFTMTELAALPFCLEGPGGFTTSAGSSVAGIWGGISLPDLLIQWAGLEEDHAVTLVAEDGYRMTFEAKEILDLKDGTWILAIIRDHAALPASMGPIRALKVGPLTPMITGHVSVARIHRIVIAGTSPRTWSLTMRGKMEFAVDRQTLQSCVSCHGSTVVVGSAESEDVYEGVALYRILAFSDDSLYAPHHQDSSILSYRGDLAQKGYTVELEDAVGHSVSYDSRALHHDDDIILALYRDGNSLPEGMAPLVLVRGSVEGRSQSAKPPTLFPRVTSVTLHLP